MPKQNASPSPPVRARTTRPRSTRRTRLRPQEREELVIREASAFFAKVGFGGKLKDLAERLGVTQPLLNRYFPTKDDLIRRIYETLYRDTWSADWDVILRDRSRPLEERLESFYRAYTDQIFGYERVRMFFMLALHGVDIRSRYLRVLRKHLILAVCRELRHELALPAASALPFTAEEEQLVHSLHSAINQLGIQEYVYGMKPRLSRAAIIRLEVRNFLLGARVLVPELVGKPKKRTTRGG